jgi:hypothetical protein
LVGSVKQVLACRLLRPMRGEAHAHLIECDDGFAYVVKLTNNPQGGRRVLVNEFVGSILLTQLGVATPELALVNIDHDFAGDVGPLPTGLHFGSRYPGTPDTVAVYDFLPDALLHKVQNREHFLGALIFDRWLSNSDARQAIFFRQPPTPSVVGPAMGSWVTQMIDNGSVFAGSDWVFRESAVQGMCARRAVYGTDLAIGVFDPWIQALMDIRIDLLHNLVKELPPDWIRGDESALTGLLVRLQERRSRVPAMVEQAIQSLAANRSSLPVHPERRS